MKQVTTILLFFLLAFQNTKAQEQLFEESYTLLKSMIEDERKYSFKDAVFSVENAYFNGKLDTAFVNREIKMLNSVVHSLTENRYMYYADESDRKTVTKWASVYSVITDTIPFIINNQEYDYIPFSYDFNDVFGHQEHSNMFVSKLLATRKGNCRSLPYLYKILAEEAGVSAHLALAPNHVYIKHQSKVHGWYNTELTSGIFPIDAWLMASGFVHIDAITNGVYLKALNNKESIALVLLDLATAYQKKFPDNDGTFLLKCA